MNKIKKYYLMGLPQLFRKIIQYVTNLMSFRLFFNKKIKSLYYFQTTNINFGKNVHVIGHCNNIKMGSNITINDNCIIKLNWDSKFNIGNECYLAYGTIIVCDKAITIGNFVQIGEYTSIRDSNHSYKRTDIPIKFQQDMAGEIIIEDDVWIGRGCMIFPNTFIGKGSIIAANSVVKGKIEPFSIYAGNPAKFIRSREVSTK